MDVSFNLRRRMLASAALVLSFVSMAAVPAVAASDLISIPIEQVVRGRPGAEILVASATVPPELVGMQCEMIGETFNQESIHIGNDLVIRLGTQTRIVENFEDEEDILKEFRDIQEMPSQVDVFVRLGPDGVSSGGFLISIDCDVTPPTTTTTEAATTTTTASTTTTTSEPATTTTEPATTTSTSAPSSTTTLILTPSSSSIAPTVPATTTTAAVQETPELAVTGSNDRNLMVMGFGLAIGGLVLVAAGRRRLDERPTG